MKKRTAETFEEWDERVTKARRADVQLRFFRCLREKRALSQEEYLRLWDQRFFEMLVELEQPKRHEPIFQRREIR